jgi:hypothetical protein
MPGDLSRFTAGAHLLRELRTLKQGKAYRLTADRLREVPANLLDRQTPSYLVEWFKIRLPFYTVVSSGLLGFWDIYRPTADEMERLMVRDGERASDDAQAFRAWQHTVDLDWGRYERDVIRQYDPTTPHIDRMRRS